MRVLLDKEVQTISDPALQNFVRMALSKVPPKFFEIPASSSGRYHPSQSLGKGGLVRHTVASCYFGRRLCRAYCIEEGSVEESIVLTALVLHDIGKAMEEPHEVIGYDWLRNFIVEFGIEQTSDLIAVLSAVRYHLGPWSDSACQARTNKDESVVFPGSFGKLTQIVHIADYVSAQKSVSLDLFDVGLRAYKCVVCSGVRMLKPGPAMPKCCDQTMEVSK